MYVLQACGDLSPFFGLNDPRIMEVHCITPTNRAMNLMLHL